VKQRAQRGSAPARLRDDAELGPLLDGADREYRRGLEEAAAFQRLSSRLERGEAGGRWRRVTLGAALSFAVASSLVVVAWGVLRQAEGERVAFGPELAEARAQALPGAEQVAQGALDEARGERDTEAARLAKPREPSAERTLAVPAEAPAAQPLDTDVAPEATLAAPAAERRIAPTKVRAPKAASGAPPMAAAHAARPRREQPLAQPLPPGAGGLTSERTPKLGHVGSRGSRIDCFDVARRGEPRAAELCFSQSAAGSGLGAERALFEMARLRRDVLRDALGALTALNDYRQRFPVGTHRQEVDISRVELLSQLGRGREALHESEAMLGASSGRERAARLHILRGNVLSRELSDWAAAAREYSLAEAFGGALGAEASRLRGQSLEALGDLPGALAAYRRYLEGAAPSPRHSDVARHVRLLSATLSVGR
jgi:hypothetical protein